MLTKEKLKICDCGCKSFIEKIGGYVCNDCRKFFNRNFYKLKEKK